ncbi:MAG: alpha/beta hydrolase fold domain-containing protein [Actinomycetota bacterium]
MTAISIALPPERPGHPADASLQEKRSRFTAPAYEGEIPLAHRELGGVPCRVLSGGDSATVLYLHGGGYRMGSAATYTAYGARLAAAAHAQVVLVDYRLAPESPFPAALHDAVSVYEAVRAERPDRHVVAAGDSAGGGLAASLSVAAAAVGAKGPDSLALLSPWLDLRCDSSYYRTATDALFDQSTALSAREAYLQGHDVEDSFVSPLRVDGAVFPSTLVQIGTAESLLGDALAFAEKLSSAGVSCRLEAVARRGHTWPLTEPDHPDSHAAITNFGRFVRDVASIPHPAAAV